MSILGNSRRLLLDDFEMFRLWYELGSLPKVQKALKTAGIINPATGRPPEQLTIRRCALRWVIENPDKARPYYQKISAEFAYEDEAWNRYLVDRAQRIYNTSVKRFLSWVDRRGFGTKYQDMYAEQFGLNND